MKKDLSRFKQLILEHEDISPLQSVLKKRVWDESMTLENQLARAQDRLARTKKMHYDAYADMMKKYGD